jgi:endonuclease/exonuclease/phosphatase family metal-dependent hydrolase
MIEYKVCMLQLLSYNVQYGKKMNEIRNWLGGLPKQPDVLCLQEYPQPHVKKSNSLHSLGYTCHFAESFTKQGVAYGELTAYQPKSLSLDSHYALSLGSSKLENRITNNTGQRTALVTTFTYKKRKVAVANIHLICFGLNKKRRNQLQLILDTLSQPTQAVILGDFNYPNHIAGSGLTKFMRANNFHSAGDNLHTHSLLGINQQVDYAFLRACEARDVRVEAINYSDHKPMFVTVKM